MIVLFSDLIFDNIFKSSVREEIILFINLSYVSVTFSINASFSIFNNLLKFSVLSIFFFETIHLILPPYLETIYAWNKFKSYISNNLNSEIKE